ncbi:hypothetical protein ACPOL_3088 [Acidisarcina polymorpha]|uniref:Uncharacterized protein n=1 Tax=Acidisarcina polymorpha TaxID=2211140 RepID=A0A2Z5G183_9BACT|nr:hypothetical protein ACPOL_3088 [Acidisarcina polymorpha]
MMKLASSDTRNTSIQLRDISEFDTPLRNAAKNRARRTQIEIALSELS